MIRRTRCTAKCSFIKKVLSLVWILFLFYFPLTFLLSRFPLSQRSRRLISQYQMWIVVFLISENVKWPTDHITEYNTFINNLQQLNSHLLHNIIFLEFYSLLVETHLMIRLKLSCHEIMFPILLYLPSIRYEHHND